MVSQSLWSEIVVTIRSLHLQAMRVLAEKDVLVSVETQAPNTFLVSA